MLKLRKFIHRHGFAGKTDYIECHVESGICFDVNVHGEKEPLTEFTLGNCLLRVYNGYWLEIEQLVTEVN